MKHPPQIINSISELHRLNSFPKPEHPLVSLVNFEDMRDVSNETPGGFIFDFYTIAIKRGLKTKIKYGQHYYDFDEGVMSFISPGQVIGNNHQDNSELAGWMLLIHPDFLRNYPLSKTIKEYGFFSYDLYEALHLSEKEEAMIETIMKNIQQEYRSVIDHYSQNVIISHIELLLNYCDRFYNRQFITRKGANSDLLIRLEALLAAHFDNQESGLPTVQYVSSQLNVSPNYLSDMLRSLTGQGTQQHIHNKLIEKAKEMLTLTSMSIGEIAYQLGFEHPQSFNKLFKSKTNISPLVFRNSFH
jgi:AraC-like DNA-binding protein